MSLQQWEVVIIGGLFSAVLVLAWGVVAFAPGLVLALAVLLPWLPWLLGAAALGAALLLVRRARRLRPMPHTGQSVTMLRAAAPAEARQALDRVLTPDFRAQMIAALRQRGELTPELERQLREGGPVG